MRTASFLLVLIAIAGPSAALGQEIVRPPSGATGLSNGWAWAQSESGPGSRASGDALAVVWTVDAAGTNWRWDNQGPSLGELLGASPGSAVRTAIVASIERGEVSALNVQDLAWPLRHDASKVAYLGKAPQMESFELVTGLSLENPELERSRLRVVAVHRTVAGVRPIILEALASGGVERRKAAAYAWAVYVAEDALQNLIGVAVNDESVEVAKAAAYAIGSVKAAASVDALVAVLDDSTRREVRKAAAYALGNLDSPEATAVLIRLVRTEQ